MTRRVVVIANGTLPEESVAQAKSVLKAGAVSAEWATTTESDPGAHKARRAAEEGADLVIAFGGDGTVRECAEGISGTDLPLGVIPAGTGNLLARNLGIPDDIEESIAVALGDNARTLDTGLANSELFAVMAGAGFDAEVMANTDSEAKERVGSLAYFLEGARHLGDPSFEATISVNGTDMARDRWATVLIGNLGRLQGGVEIFPDASPDDGALEVLGISAETATDRLAAGFEAVVGDGVGEHLLRATGSEIRLEMTEPIKFELDGDSRPAVKVLDVEVQPRSLRILVPEGSQ
jgi:YegS/Rv2252/BmrU family lipid kinase